MIRIHTPARTARNILLSAAIAGSGMAGLIGFAGNAHASTNGLVTVASCGALAGKVTYSPGLLTSTAQQTDATVTGHVANCTNGGNGHLTGFGSVTFSLSGDASLNAENFGSGTFTIKWPSPLTPSEGTAGVVESNGIEELSGTVTSGPYTGDEISVNYVSTGKTGSGTAADPVTAQNYINDQNLTVTANNG
jgi:hypothetical protein